jgi:hypothetical protein
MLIKQFHNEVLARLLVGSLFIDEILLPDTEPTPLLSPATPQQVTQRKFTKVTQDIVISTVLDVNTLLLVTQVEPQALDRIRDNMLRLVKDEADKQFIYPYVLSSFETSTSPEGEHNTRYNLVATYTTWLGE